MVCFSQAEYLFLSIFGLPAFFLAHICLLPAARCSVALAPRTHISLPGPLQLQAQCTPPRPPSVGHGCSLPRSPAPSASPGSHISLSQGPTSALTFPALLLSAVETATGETSWPKGMTPWDIDPGH